MSSSNPTFVNDMDLFGNRIKQIPCIVGEGSPTESTAGAVGMLYMDTSSNNGDMYKCVKVEDSKYTWEKLVSEDNGENVAQTEHRLKGHTMGVIGDSLSDRSRQVTQWFDWIATRAGGMEFGSRLCFRQTVDAVPVQHHERRL